MSKAKHTPGPWKVDLCFFEAAQVAKNQEEVKANAHLIAAAPEMLEALEEILLALDGKISVDTPDEIKQAMVKAIKAFSKARGEV